MNEKKNLKIAFCSTRRNVFSREDALKHKNQILKKVKDFDYQIADIEDINEDGLLVGNEDVEKSVKKLKKEDVDCLFFSHCNFGTEDVVAKVAKKINKPILLWGPRDEAPLEDGI